MNRNRIALKGIKKRRRLSPKEHEELRKQLEAGDTGPSFGRMQRALEARNWTFLYECSYSHLTLSKESSRNLIYFVIAAARLGRHDDLCKGAFLGWITPQASSELAREAAVVFGMLRLTQFSLAFFAIHQLLSQRKEGQEFDSPELTELFRDFLKSSNVEPRYRSQHPNLLLPHYFTLLIQEIADSIPTPSDSLDLYL